MEERRQRTVAAWSVVVLGGVGLVVAFRFLEGRWLVDAITAYVASITLAAAAGALPVPWHPHRGE